MYKNILKYLLGITLAVIMAGQVYAASNLAIRIEQPKSPTNQNNFNLSFVTLDISGRSIVVSCFKKGPSDGSFTQFGSSITVTDGGNSGNCPVNDSILNTSGTYEFYATAIAGSDTITSKTYFVDYSNTGGPGTPTDFSKSKATSCQYEIKYKTADDNGITVKVELYRSEDKSFNADSNTRIASHGIGSNATDTFTDNIPDCNKTYYYAIRAFDKFENGSVLAGDTSTTIVNPTTVTQETAGAISVDQTEGQVSEALTPIPTGSQSAEENGEVKGTKEGPTASFLSSIFSWRNILIVIAIIIVSGIAYYIIQSSGKKK